MPESTSSPVWLNRYLRNSCWLQWLPEGKWICQTSEGLAKLYKSVREKFMREFISFTADAVEPSSQIGYQLCISMSTLSDSLSGRALATLFASTMGFWVCL
ncbi:Uncharacterised protein [uncultured archaeon]|nr:Uncharacterised protein [uncultured archaeon]